MESISTEVVMMMGAKKDKLEKLTGGTETFNRGLRGLKP
jgi:chemotaxis receptor (MCP) glutamine deamidase CheD